MIQFEEVRIQGGPLEQHPVSLTIDSGQYAVLMGQTGQGKTTLLEAICGLRRVTHGSIRIDGEDVTRLKPADRGIGYVPQDLALFPQMTVQQHLEFALKLRREASTRIRARVNEVAEVLGITRLLSRGVGHLSGGEAQRVALGRAIAFRPRVLLLDEPLAALDAATRDRLCELLKRLPVEHPLTTLHVTHHQREAARLATRLLVMEGHQVRERSLESLQPGDV